MVVVSAGGALGAAFDLDANNLASNNRASSNWASNDLIRDCTEVIGSVSD